MKLATCHPNRKHQARGLCGACYLKWKHENNPEAHEKYKEYQRKHQKDTRVEGNERSKRWRNSPDPRIQRLKRTQMLKRKYKMTADDYDVLANMQGEGCAICGRKRGKTPLHVDHCHETGIVRGLLCHQCNWYLSALEDSIEVRKKLFEYLTMIDEVKALNREPKPAYMEKNDGNE